MAMLDHEKLSWAMTDQSLKESAIEWLCMDIDGCKIVYIYKPPTLQPIPTAISVFPHPTQTGVMIVPVQIKNASLSGQPRATSLSYAILRIPPAFSLAIGTAFVNAGLVDQRPSPLFPLRF